MTPELQTFLNTCATIPEIVSVTVEDPSAIIMAQISESFQLSQSPVLFHFVVKDSTGASQPVDILISYEALSQRSGPPVTELVKAADRHREVPAYGIRFVPPDGTMAYPLVGHKWTPISDIPSELADLIGEIGKLDNVDSVAVHEVVDPEIITSTGYDNAVRVVINIKELTDVTANKDGYHHDYCNFVVAKQVYLDTASHPEMISRVSTAIATILAKQKLC